MGVRCLKITVLCIHFTVISYSVECFTFVKFPCLRLLFWSQMRSTTFASIYFKRRCLRHFNIYWSKTLTGMSMYVCSLQIFHSYLSVVIAFFTARKRSLRRLCFHRCLSVHIWGSLSRRPPYGYVRAVRILLECILVSAETSLSSQQILNEDHRSRMERNDHLFKSLWSIAHCNYIICAPTNSPQGWMDTHEEVVHYITTVTRCLPLKAQFAKTFVTQL